MIRRGSTPVNVIKTDTDLEDAIDIRIVYKQDDKIVLEKTIDDIEIDEETKKDIYVSISQEESLSFTPNRYIAVQVRVKYPDGVVIVSNVMYDKTEDLLKDEVI